MSPSRAHIVSEEAHVTPLPGKRVLITEDEFLLAMWLRQVLEEEGYAVVGPATSVEEAVELIEKAKPNGAILDINLKGEMVYPAAKELMERGIPFVFAASYSTLDVPTTFRSIRVWRNLLHPTFLFVL